DILIASIIPSNAINQQLYWESDNNGVASVDQGGFVRAKGFGQTRIIVEAENGFQASCDVEVSIRLTSVTLSPQSYELDINKKYSGWSVSYLPDNATTKEVRWTSSDESKVGINPETGEIIGKAEGSSIITAIATDGSGKTATSLVNVIIPVDRVVVSPRELTFAVGKTRQLEATVFPENASIQAVTWESDNKSIADVDDRGKVTAREEGSTFIVVKTKQGEKLDTCVVNVLHNRATGVVPSKKVAYLSINEKEILHARVMPPEATNQKVHWSSNASHIASVDPETGEVTGKNTGKAVITVTSDEGGYSNEVFVFVTNKKVDVTGIRLNKSITYVLVDEGERLGAIFTPSDATNQNVTWSSSNEFIAKVDQGGFIEGLREGEVTITARTQDGNYADTCEVTVSSKRVGVTGLLLNKGRTQMLNNAQELLSAIVFPYNATNQNVVWKSSNESVALVDMRGVVFSVGLGTAVITAETNDGKYQDQCEVLVASKVVGVTGLIMNKSSTSIKLGETELLSAIVLPYNATNQKLRWSSSDESTIRVSESGLMKAKKVGDARIFVVTDQGNYRAECIVRVTNTNVSVTRVEISEKKKQLEPDSVFVLMATVLPSGATNQNLIWKSSHKATASVDTRGFVIAKNIGRTTISVTTVDGLYKDECEIEVSIRVSSVFIVSDDDIIDVDTIYSGLSVMIEPEDATTRSVLWSSTEETVATIDKNTGLLHAVGGGVTTIKAVATDGSEKFDTKEIRVVVPVKTVTVIPKTLRIEVGETQPLAAEVLPYNATDTGITWKSDNDLIAKPDAVGKVTGVSRGTTKIFAISNSDKTIKGFCDVNVYFIDAEDIEMDKNITYVLVSGKEKLKARIIPYNATNQKITWNSPDPSTVSVNSETGEVSALKEGRIRISAIAKDGDYKASTIVFARTTPVSVTGININKKETRVQVGNSELLGVIFNPSDATNQNVRWTTDRPSVLSVDDGGLITGLKAGSATITVSTPDNRYRDTCEVQVISLLAEKK
ncbi:MAG: Ig-like domain-containing protein, partial [Treponemataceae bacterium]